jgi:hypothetical protein
MKKVILLLVGLLLIVGCNRTEVYQDGENVVTITNDEVVDKWCGESTIKSSGPNGEANIVIEGVETSGKYAGYCHGTYKLESPNGNLNVDYYFDQEGNGYTVSEINGQTYESEYHQN